MVDVSGDTVEKLRPGGGDVGVDIVVGTGEVVEDTEGHDHAEKEDGSGLRDDRGADRAGLLSGGNDGGDFG